MTKPINIQQIEKEILKELPQIHGRRLPKLVLKVFKKYIKQIVGSVPVEEKDEFDAGLSARDTIMNAYSKGKEAGKPIGYNQKTQEIKQWKKKILEEIER